MTKIMFSRTQKKVDIFPCKSKYFRDDATKMSTERTKGKSFSYRGIPSVLPVALVCQSMDRNAKKGQGPTKM